MALVRARLRRDGAECQQAKERWTDWKTHVRAHPWLACGAAAALGYVLIPARHSAPFAAPSPSPPPPLQRREASLLGRLAGELARRAAQQAIAGGAAWAIAHWSARRAQREQSHPHLAAPALEDEPSREFAP